MLRVIIQEKQPLGARSVDLLQCHNNPRDADEIPVAFGIDQLALLNLIYQDKLRYLPRHCVVTSLETWLRAAFFRVLLHEACVFSKFLISFAIN